MTRQIAGEGTGEDVWRPWLAQQDRPWLDVDALVRAPRIVVLAAHPDDEVLGAGGTLARLTGPPAVLVWASDGEASHPDAGIDPGELGRQRRAESVRALDVLGVRRTAERRLGLPDSGLAAHGDVLRSALRAETAPGSVVLAPWRGDGHPDHEVCGRVAADVAGERAATLIEFPIWAWHWAVPDDPRVPWHRTRVVPLSTAVAESKRAALACFASQIEPLGPRPEQAAVLPPEVLARFERGTEVVFG